MNTTHDGGCKRTIQPTSTLANEFDGGFGHICLSLARFDVGERPSLAGFSHQLKTKDTILSQEHVLREDTHSVDTLSTQAIRERVVTVEVLLEWPAKDSAESVR